MTQRELKLFELMFAKEKHETENAELKKSN